MSAYKQLIAKGLLFEQKFDRIFDNRYPADNYSTLFSLHLDGNILILAIHSNNEIKIIRPVYRDIVDVILYIFTRIKYKSIYIPLLTPSGNTVRYAALNLLKDIEPTDDPVLTIYGTLIKEEYFFPGFTDDSLRLLISGFVESKVLASEGYCLAFRGVSEPMSTDMAIVNYAWRIIDGKYMIRINKKYRVDVHSEQYKEKIKEYIEDASKSRHISALNYNMLGLSWVFMPHVLAEKIIDGITPMYLF